MKSGNGGAERWDEIKKKGLSSSPSEMIRNVACEVRGHKAGMGYHLCEGLIQMEKPSLAEGELENLISWEEECPSFDPAPKILP